MAYYEEALAEYEAAGDETGRLTTLQNLASDAIGRGDYQRAISLLRDKIASTGDRDTYSLALAIGLLGFALAGNGENEEARQSFEQSLEICAARTVSRARKRRYCWVSPSSCGRQVRRRPSSTTGRASSSPGRWAIWGSSPTVFGASPQSPSPAEMREKQRLCSAFSPRSTSASARVVSPGDKEELDAAIAQAREALGNEAFEAAWTEGGALSVEQAVDLSLTVTGPQAADPDTT